MSGGIPKRDAEAIVTKLEAVPRSTRRRRHLRFAVYVDGIHWTTIGFSHGKHNANMNIPGELQIPYKETMQLARCTKSQSWYFERVRAKLREAGILPPSPRSTAPSDRDVERRRPKSKPPRRKGRRH